MVKDLELTTVKCVNCGFTWQPRVKKPKRCPKCQSYYWRNPSQLLKEKKRKKKNNVV